ncbi:MAG: restriction endonuclease subunit S [Chromatiaceae bacterium]
MSRSAEIPTGYKQTEVGVIPEDWVVAPLGALTEPTRPISYGIVQTGQCVRNGVRCLRVLDIDDGRINKTNLVTTTKAISDAYKRTVLKAGDLVTPLRGKVGDVAMVDEDLAGSNLTRGVALIAIQSDWSASFCKQFIASPATRSRLEQSMNGSALQEVPIATFRAFKIAFPPSKAEQEAIAEALSDADALIESLEQLLAKKRQIKQGVMQELLTGKRRLPGFSGEWEVKRLGKLGEFLKGKGVTRDQAQSGTLPCVRYGEIYTTHRDYIRAFQSWISAEVASTATRLRSGDVLFAGSGETKEEIGKCVAFVGDRETYAGGDIVILRPRDIDPLFFGYAMNTPSVNRQKASLGQGDAVVHISAAALADVSLPVPEKPEQTAIAEVLSDMDAEIAALEAKLAKARRLKQGMMQELLTGRIRLV